MRFINGTAVCTNDDAVYINAAAAFINGGAVYKSHAASGSFSAVYL